MKSRLVTIILLVLVFAGAAYAEDAVRVTTTVAADSLTVGERFHVVHQFVFPDTLDIVRPDRIESGSCRVLAAVWSEDDRPGVKHRSLNITAMTLDLEAARLPGPNIPFLSASGDTVWAFVDDVEIPVRHQITSQSMPRAIKPQWEAPRSWWGWVTAGVTALALAVFAWWWLRRRRRLIAAEPEPVLPADYVALTELTRVEKLGLLEQEQYKTYYSLVTNAVRHYIERRYGIDAMDLTTNELVWDLEARRISVDKLDTLLNEADLVKFAKFVPQMESGQAAIRCAREIVVSTTPKTVSSEAAETLPVIEGAA